MSWGVNLAMAGAAARGMRQAQDDQADFEFTEKARDYHLKNLASNEAMRPEREAAERGRLQYQSEFYRGANETLPMERENQRLQLGVNNTVLKQQGAEAERAAKMTESMRGAAASGWARAKELNLPPEQAMSVVLEHQAQAAFANNDPVRAQQIMEAMNTERARQSFRLFNEAVQAQMTGNMPALATSLTNLYNTLNPGSPGSVVPVMTEQPVAGMPPPTPSAFRLTLERDGQVTTQDLTPEQMKALSMQYINMIGSDPIAAIEGQREVAKQRAIAQAKGEQDRETAAFKGENFVKVKTGENQEMLVDPRTGQMIGGGGMGAGGSGGRQITAKETDQVHTQVASMFKDQMSTMTPETGAKIAKVSAFAISLMQNNALDPVTNMPVGPLQAVELARAIVMEGKDPGALRYGQAQPQGGSYGVGQSAAPSAATPAAGGGAAPPDAQNWRYGEIGGRLAYWKLDASGNPAVDSSGKPIAWEQGGSAAAAAATPATPATVSATPGIQARPENTTTAAGTGEPLAAAAPASPAPQATPVTPAAPAAAPAPDKARADLVAQAKDLDRNIALLRTQIEGERPGLNVAGARKALASFEQRRAALGISPEEVATFGETSRVREESEARSRAARVQATIRPPSPDRVGAKPARPVDVLDDEVVSPVPAASTAPTTAAPAATTPPPARPRPSAPAARGVNALDPTAFSPNMGTQVMPAAAGAPTSAPPPAAPAPRKSEERKPATARPVAEGATEFERTKGYGVRGKGTPDKGQDTTEAKPTQGMPQLPKPDSVTSMGDESAPNHIVNVRRQVSAQAQERLQRADLAFFEKYAQFLQPEERSRWVKALNERIAKDGMSGLVPKTRKYVVGPDGNLMRAAN